jgi:hypothetical protein
MVKKIAKSCTNITSVYRRNELLHVWNKHVAVFTDESSKVCFISYPWWWPKIRPVHVGCTTTYKLIVVTSVHLLATLLHIQLNTSLLHSFEGSVHKVILPPTAHVQHASYIVNNLLMHWVSYCYQKSYVNEVILLPRTDAEEVILLPIADLQQISYIANNN